MSAAEKTLEESWDFRFASLIYRWRWLFATIAVAATALLFVSGGKKLGEFSEAVAVLGDTSSGSGSHPPVVFDPSLDIWFSGLNNGAIETYREIEERFIAEDFIIVAFEAEDDPYGVFGRESLAAIDRLTENFLKIPGVRHVRSLTYNPWIRWGEIEDATGTEMGLVISDLVAGDPAALTEHQIIERMVAVLGARAASERIGEDKVRAVIGQDANFEDHIGEPLLLGTIINAEGTTTALQVQVFRPQPDPAVPEERMPGDPAAQSAVAGIHATNFQRAALRGVEHYLRVEGGLAVESADLPGLKEWVESEPDHETREGLVRELEDPTRNFMVNGDGDLVRKFHEYEPMPGGGYLDTSDPSDPIPAPAGFAPTSLSPFEFHLGGVPVFERNFETVGMGDGKLMQLMFLMVALCLLVIFRRAAAVMVPMIVLVATIMATIGFVFGRGDLLNNMTMMTPNVLTAVAIADAIHLIAAWAGLRGRFENKRQLIIEVIRRNALALLLTSITTAIGFYTLTVSTVGPVKMFGYTAAFGTLAAYVLTISLVPALLSLFTDKPVSSAKASFFTTERSGNLAGWIVRNRVAIVSAGAFATLIAAVGVAKVEVDMATRNMFKASNPTIESYDWIEARMGGVNDLDIVFHGIPNADPDADFSDDERSELESLRIRRLVGGKADANVYILSQQESTRLSDLEHRERKSNASRIGVSAEFIATLDAFERRLRQEMADGQSPLRFVTDLYSPLDILRKMHQVQNANRGTFYRVPASDDLGDEVAERASFDEILGEWSRIPEQDASSLIAQYYLQYENGARPGENLTTQLSADRSQFRIQGRLLQASSLEHRDACTRIEQIAKEEFPTLGGNVSTAGEPPLVTVSTSGKTLLHAISGHRVSVEFLRSLAIAIAVISCIIGILFRSATIAIVSILPNLFPILLPLSAFGLLGIELSAPAAFVASIALGVCVDDTIHLFTNYQRARRSGLGSEGALAEALHHVGAPVTVTTIVLVIGFATLALGSFIPNVLLGILATSMIAIAWATDLILTPALLSLVDRSNKPQPTD